MPRAFKQRRIRVGAFAVGVAALGILLWARLILVTGHPRSAIATPDRPVPAQATKPEPPRSTAPATQTTQRDNQVH